MFFFFQAEDGIRDVAVTGVQTCALPICGGSGDGSSVWIVAGVAAFADAGRAVGTDKLAPRRGQCGGKQNEQRADRESGCADLVVACRGGSSIEGFFGADA